MTSVPHPGPAGKRLLLCLTVCFPTFAILNNPGSVAWGAPRAQHQDHRGGSPGGQAVPGGWHIKCVIPFCGHSFNPHGTRPRDQDHRGPRTNVPPITNRGGHVGQPRPRGDADRPPRPPGGCRGGAVAEPAGGQANTGL